MLSQKTLNELAQINSDFNEISDEFYGFKYQTDGWCYECITFGEHVLWDSEDLTERDDETVIECVKRRFNNFLDEINQCRYTDVPIGQIKKRKDIYDAFDEMIDNLHNRGIWITEDDNIYNEVTDFWLNTLKKFIPFGYTNSTSGPDKAVNKIVDDLVNKKGFRQIWFDIDEDTQEKIKEKWVNIIKGNV
jgi:hypothetical protein